jgi:hypothetical protein
MRRRDGRNDVDVRCAARDVIDIDGNGNGGEGGSDRGDDATSDGCDGANATSRR